MASTEWTTALVDKHKLDIKNAIEASSSDSNQKKLRFILQSLRKIEESNSDVRDLQQYIYCMSALVHHERHGGLRDNQINSLYEMAFTLLQMKGINPTKSRLRFLYGELLQIYSLIQRKSGNQWSAAWGLQMAVRYRSDSDQNNARQILGAAIRDMRLGNCRKAIAACIEAEKIGLPPRQLVTARLVRILSNRLRSEFAEAKDLISDTSKLNTVSDDQHLDLSWNSICIRLSETRDHTEMIKAVSAGGSHRQSFYFLEAFLWARASASRKWEDQLPMVRSMARTRSLRVHKEGYFYKCVQVIEHCYDQDVPFESRLSNLGMSLSERQRMVAIDSELLMLAASTTWLARNHAFNLASLVMNEYESLSVRISDGQTKDALGIISHLMSKDWHQ